MALAASALLASVESFYLKAPNSSSETTPVVRAFGVSSIESFKPTKAFRGTSQKHDKLTFRFDVDADLRPLFHWNTKQLFVYVSIEYEAENTPVNQVVVFDQIITNVRDARLELKNAKTEYALSDPRLSLGVLLGKRVNVKLVVDVMPYFGRPLEVVVDAFDYELPSEYLV